MRHIGECSIPIVAVKGVAQRWIRIVKITAATVYEINIHPAIIVVIEKSAACAGRLRQVGGSGPAIHVGPMNTTDLGGTLTKRGPVRISPAAVRFAAESTSGAMEQSKGTYPSPAKPITPKNRRLEKILEFPCCDKILLPRKSETAASEQ